MGTFRAVVAGMAVVTLWAAAASGLAREPARSEDSIQRLQAAVDAYVALRGKVTQALPPLEISPDAENFLMASEAAAAAIRAARPSAAEGDIINAEAAALLQRRVRATLAQRGCSVDAILAAQRDDDRLPLPPRPVVHDQFDWGWGSFMPSCVLSVLPLLPDELQFRFVQRDLVLVDVGADLVVDVLPDALPPSESWKGVRYAADDVTRRPRRGDGVVAMSPYAAVFAALGGSPISTRRAVGCAFAGSGTATSSTPLENVALTSSSFAPCGSGTAR